MNREEKNIYIETIDRKNKEIDKLRLELKSMQEFAYRFMGYKPSVRCGKLPDYEDIEVSYNWDTDIKKNDVYKVIKLKKVNNENGDYFTNFTLRRVRKYE